MTLDELVGNLKTYEMNMDDLKKEDVIKEKSLALKASDSDDSDFDEDQVAFLAKSFKRFLKKEKGYDNKGKCSKKGSNDKSPPGCYKCYKIDHMIKDFPLWEIEWRKERAEKDRAKKEKKDKEKRKEKENYAMMATWEFEFDDSDNEKVDETALMAIGDSDLDEGDKNFEVRVKGCKRHWYMDSACSRHMTEDKKKILSLTLLKEGSVSFGYGRKGTVTGIGKIGKTEAKTLEVAYHVDGLKHNLLSISQLCDKGNKVTFTFVGCKVKKLDTKEIVLIASR